MSFKTRMEDPVKDTPTTDLGAESSKPGDGGEHSEVADPLTRNAKR